MNHEPWPALPLSAWRDTCATLHLWTQVVGKIRLAQTPVVNHWWNTPLYVTARGLTTSLMPHGTRAFQIDFDFIDHQLCIAVSDGGREVIALRPQSVASFYAEVMNRLRALGLDVHIWTMPVEIPDAIPFDRDETHAAYDGDYANRFWRILVHADRVLNRFRARYLGKVSPVHFFWGSFDMAVTRFSGRPSPEHPGVAPNLGAWVMREAYSHEVSSAGLWPGSGPDGAPMFYAYAYPQPDGFAAAKVRPAAAYWDEALGEFLLPYDAIRSEPDPDELLMQFLDSTYAAAADLGGWDRAALERQHPA